MIAVSNIAMGTPTQFDSTISTISSKTYDPFSSYVASVSPVTVSSNIVAPVTYTPTQFDSTIATISSRTRDPVTEYVNSVRSSTSSVVVQETHTPIISDVLMPEVYRPPQPKPKMTPTPAMQLQKKEYEKPGFVNSEYGTIYFTSVPLNCTVYIDSYKGSITPWARDVTTGSHNFSCYKEGYKIVTQRIVVRNDDKIPFDVVLEKIENIVEEKEEKMSLNPGNFSEINRTSFEQIEKKEAQLSAQLETQQNTANNSKTQQNNIAPYVALMSIAAVFITVMYFKNRYVRVCANSEDIARNDDATLRETGATENDMNTQEKIIKVLKENEELTPEQISKYLGVPLRTVQYHIKKIKEVNNEL
jgi:hypothetical protein